MYLLMIITLIVFVVLASYDECNFKFHHEIDTLFIIIFYYIFLI